MSHPPADYTETDAFAYDLDDTLLWRSLPGIIPLNSYMYLAQLKDLLKVAGPSLLRTFSSLIVRNASADCNSTIWLNFTETAPGGVPFPYPPPQWVSADEGGRGGDPESVIRPVHTNESAIQRAYEHIGFPLNRTNVTAHGPCAHIRPARLIASIGEPYPCKPKCGLCDTCTADCSLCRAQSGWGTSVCAARCVCATRCNECTSCRWTYPSNWRRLGAAEELNVEEARASRKQAARTLKAERRDAHSTVGGRRGAKRRLWDTPDGCLVITFTATARPFASEFCSFWEPTHYSRTICGLTDIETLNGVIHMIDRPLLPPSVLLQLYREGHRPFNDGPRYLDPLPVCPFEPADSFYALPFNSPAEFFQ